VHTLQAITNAAPVPAGTETLAFSRFTRTQGPLGRKTFNRQPSVSIESGLLGKLVTPASARDGLQSLIPPPQGVATDPTIGLALLAWQTVRAFEIANLVKNLAVVVKAANVVVPKAALHVVAQVVPHVAPVANALRAGAPVLRLLPALKIAQPLAAVVSLTPALELSLTPSSGIFRRFQSRVSIPDGVGNGKTSRVMACPQFIAPLAVDLKDTHPDWLLPGLGSFPDNRVALLQADGAFIESFLAGVNHEMNREMLWRGYPTDQRGTPFRYFWPRADRTPDIPWITDWPLSNPLGKNGTKNAQDVENLTVFLVRGEIVHRYPRLMVYAVPRIGQVPMPHPDPAKRIHPDFALRLDGRTTAFAYNLEPGKIAGKPGFYFVFSEPITGPRFNFDEDTPGQALKIWSDLQWKSVADLRGFAFAGNDLPVKPADTAGAKWNADASNVARIAFARPFQIAFHADELLAAEAAPGA
jgi:hypothetical protein